MTVIQLISLAIILLIAFVLILLVRNRALKEKYVWLWLVLILGALVMAIYPPWLFSLTAALGFELPSNFVFFAVITVLVLMEVHQAMAISRFEEERRRLAEEIAILRSEVTDLQVATSKDDPEPRGSGDSDQ